MSSPPFACLPAKAGCPRWTALLGAIALTVAATALVAQEPSRQQRDAPKVDDVAAFMRMKLTHSQHVLEGLAVQDFDAIARGANALALASQASSWQVLQTEEYARQSREFRRSCESLRTAARDENLDGAALAWMEVTMKCIQCHKYVRGAAKEASTP
jgi:hypothetical protein